MEENNITQATQQTGVMPAEDNAAYMPAKPLRPPLDLRDALTAWGCLLLGFLFTRWVAATAASLSGGIFWALVGALTVVYAKIKGLGVTARQWVVFAIAEVFCAVPLFCSDGTLNVFAAIFSFALLCYFAASVSGCELFGRYFVRDLLSAVFARPFGGFGSAPRAAFSLFKGGARSKTVLYVFIGLAAAIPLTLVVVPLLISSDGAFEGIMNGLISWLPAINARLFLQLILGVPVGFFIFGMLFSMRRPVERRSEGAPAYRFVPVVVSCAAVTPVCVFYLIYILSQLRYLTAAFGGELPEGLSFSEYARRGFFELCAVAFINLCVIAAIQAFTRRGEGDARPVCLRAYTAALCVFSLLLTACALSKMALYIRSMGMTQLRVYTSWFMLVMAAAFALIIAWQVRELPFWRIMFAAFTVMFGALCFSNPEGVIARHNYNAYCSGELSDLDARVLNGCGDSGVKYIVLALERGDAPENEASLRAALEARRYDIEQKSGFAWASIPRLTAQQALAGYSPAE